MTDIRKPFVKSHNTANQSNFGLLLMLGLLAYSPAQAQELDSVAIQKLALQGTWVAEHPEFGNWSWVESGVYTVAEEIDELCRQLAIEIPQDEPASLFVIFEWAGANGWQLQTMEQRRGYVEAWFKRPR